MRELNFKQMEEVHGGMNNLSKAVCTAGTVAWALGAVLAPTGWGLALWAVGGATVLYCNGQMAGVIPE